MEPVPSSSSAATTSFAYDPAFNQMTSSTDPLGHNWTLTLDAYGNVTGMTDPLGHQAETRNNCWPDPIHHRRGQSLSALATRGNSKLTPVAACIGPGGSGELPPMEIPLIE